MTDPNPPLIRRHRLVGNDIIDIAKYIGKDSPDAALRFFDAVDATLLGPSEMPGNGAAAADQQSHLPPPPGGAVSRPAFPGGWSNYCTDGHVCVSRFACPPTAGPTRQVLRYDELGYNAQRMHLDNDERTFIRAAFDLTEESGADVDAQVISQLTDLHPQHAADLLLILTNKGVFDGLSFGNTATWTPEGKQLARKLRRQGAQGGSERTTPPFAEAQAERLERLLIAVYEDPEPAHFDRAKALDLADPPGRAGRGDTALQGVPPRKPPSR